MEKFQVMVFAWATTPNGFVVILKEVDGKERQLQIIIGPMEMHSIILFLSNEPLPRPITYDLMKTLGDLAGGVKEVVVSELKEEVFYAKIIIGDEEIDARPSDAINLALRANAPIYVNEEVFEKDSAFKKQMEKPKENVAKPKTGETAETKIGELSRNLNEAIKKNDHKEVAKLKEEIRKLMSKKEK